jgi:hypothetical protein
MKLRNAIVAKVLILSICLAQHPAAPPAGRIELVVIAGDGALNIIDSGIAASPIVEVRGPDGNPVAGATVTFTLPHSGARAMFSGDKESVSRTTEGDGRVKPGELRPIEPGKFEIAVKAQLNGQDFSATIHQENVATFTDAQGLSLNANSFKIEILEGDDGVNIIDKDTAVRSIVRIVDKNNLPVAGIAVAGVFIGLDATGEFDGGGKSATVLTDAHGNAQFDLIHPKGSGPFQLQFQASVQGEPLKTTVSQTNYASERAALDAGKIPGTSRGDLTSAPGRTLQVKIVSGQAGTNVVKNKIIAKQVVEVNDSSGAPVAGVKVAFLLPVQGAGAVFADGKSYLIATTDEAGRADAGQMRLTGKGSFEIKVLAAYQGANASAAIQQTNFATVAAARKAGKVPGSSQQDTASTDADNATAPANPAASGAATGMSAGTRALLALAGAAAAVGGAAAAAAGNKSTTASAPSSSSSCSTTLLAKLSSDITTVENTCPTTAGQGQCYNPKGACATACQTFFNDLGPLCTSCGQSLPSGLSQSIIQAGLNPPAGCH